MSPAPTIIQLLKMDRLLSLSGGIILDDKKYKDEYVSSLIELLPINPIYIDALSRWQKSVLSRNPMVIGLIDITERLITEMIQRIARARTTSTKTKLIRAFAIIVTITIMTITARDILVVAKKNLDLNLDDSHKIKAGIKFHERFMRSLIGKLGGKKRALKGRKK